MIAGAMPKWRRYFHRFAAGFMCLWFCGLAFIGMRTVLPTGEGRADRARAVVGLLFLAFGVVATAGQLWFQRRIVCDFSYDGYTLQFRTLGGQAMQMRPLLDLKEVREWRGRGGPQGFRLRFRDKQRVYLEYAVSNSITLAERLRADLGASPTSAQS